MDEKQFDLLIEQTIKKNIQTLFNETGQQKILQLSKIQSLSLPKLLNAHKPSEIKGYLFDQIRGEDQILYKPGMNKQQIQTFNDYEQKILAQFSNQLQFVSKKISQKQFHYFSTLEQLRRHPLSKYFMTAPDPLYFELYDLDQTITESLDIRIIASKVLRRLYETDDDFEVDMVTMIHNFRLAFMNDKEMYDISIKFEKLFWDNYSDYSPEKPEFMTSFQYLKKRCTPSKRHSQKKRYNEKKKQELANEFMKFGVETRLNFLRFIDNRAMDQYKQILENSTKTDISKFPYEFYQQLQKFIRIQKQVNRQKKIKLREIQRKQSKIRKKVTKQKKVEDKKRKKSSQAKNSFDDIYYGDSEEEAPQLQQQDDLDRQAIKHVQDEINVQDLYFDSDEYD